MLQSIAKHVLLLGFGHFATFLHRVFIAEAFSGSAKPGDYLLVWGTQNFEMRKEESFFPGDFWMNSLKKQNKYTPEI